MGQRASVGPMDTDGTAVTRGGKDGLWMLGARGTHVQAVYLSGMDSGSS